MKTIKTYYETDITLLDRLLVCWRTFDKVRDKERFKISTSWNRVHNKWKIIITRNGS